MACSQNDAHYNPSIVDSAKQRIRTSYEKITLQLFLSCIQLCIRFMSLKGEYYIQLMKILPFHTWLHGQSNRIVAVIATDNNIPLRASAITEVIKGCPMERANQDRKDACMKSFFQKPDKDGLVISLTGWIIHHSREGIIESASIYLCI